MAVDTTIDDTDKFGMLNLADKRLIDFNEPSSMKRQIILIYMYNREFNHLVAWEICGKNAYF